MAVESVSSMKCENFVGIISNVLNSNTFYVVKEESKDLLANLQKQIDEEELCQMFWIPQINDRFLINTNEGIFRAQRISSSKRMVIQLIDTGEILDLTTSNHYDIFFDIPENFKVIPPFAEKVIWNNTKALEQLGNINVDNFLELNIYNKFLFEIESFVDGCYVASIKHIADTKIEDNMPDALTVTKEDIDMLYEEPLNTEKALIAVQGFETHDDKRCKFYDPKTGGCFKGGNCTQIHLPDLTDGFERRDKEMTNFSEPIAELPSILSYHAIKITHFIQINRFFCHIVDTDDQILAFKNLMQKMNADEQVHKYKKLDHLPAFGQLVIVRQNKFYYRARIVGLSDEDDKLEVFFVDAGFFGNVPPSALFQWNLHFTHEHFLAHEMEIIDIDNEIDNEKREKGIEEILHIQRNSGDSLTALIISADANLKCQLFDNNGDSLSELLISLNIGKRKNFIQPYLNSANYTVPL